MDSHLGSGPRRPGAGPPAALRRRRPQSRNDHSPKLLEACRPGTSAGSSGERALPPPAGGSGRRRRRAARCASPPRTVIPLSWFRRRSRSWSRSPVARSRLPEGSSARSARGDRTSARATATRCCSPPDISPGPVMAAVREPHLLEEGLRRPPRLPVGNARDEQRHHHVLEGGELREQVVELEDEADGAVAELAQARLGKGQRRPRRRRRGRRRRAGRGSRARAGGSTSPPRKRR